MSRLGAYRRAVRGREFGEDLAPAFVSAWEELEAAYFRLLDAATVDLGSWRERFRAGAELTLTLAEEHQAAARFLVLEPPAAGALGPERQSAFAARLAELVDSAREELPDPGQVAAATADWIVAIFFDRIYRRSGGESGTPLPDQLPELLFLAVSAYFGTEAGLRELF